MIDRGHTLPLVRQAELLRLSRNNLYYRASAGSEARHQALLSRDQSIEHPENGGRDRD